MHTGVVVDGKEIAADAVVIAMGPWSGQAAKWLPIPSITGQKYASIVLRPEQEITNHMLFLSYKTSSGTVNCAKMMVPVVVATTVCVTLRTQLQCCESLL